MRLFVLVHACVIYTLMAFNLVGLALPLAEPSENAPVLTYAIIDSEITLYSDSMLNRAITTLPPTYFVVVLASGNGYLQVSYSDLSGYISASGVTIVDYEPVTKFATVFRFSVNNDGYPASLRSMPDHQSGNKLYEIPSGSGGIYYGSALGTSMILEAGNLWYYVRYSGGIETLYGYVYKTQVKVDPIENNKIEKVAALPPPTPPTSPFETGDITSILIILALSIPAAFIMLLIFRRPSKPSPRFDKSDK